MGIISSPLTLESEDSVFYKKWTQETLLFQRRLESTEVNA